MPDSLKTYLARPRYLCGMCRSIKKLRGLDAPASNDEIRDAALQFVRKVSGFHRPARVNQEAFQRAVEEIASSSAQLLESLTRSRVHS